MARRYLRQWRAAAARGDVARMRSVAEKALRAAAEAASAEMRPEREAMDELLAAQRRIELAAGGEAAPRMPAALRAFDRSGLKRYRRAWAKAVGSSDHGLAARVVRDAIGTLSRRIALKLAGHARVRARLARLRSAPLAYRPDAACSFCGRGHQRAAGRGRLAICADCAAVCAELIRGATDPPVPR